MRRGHPGRVAGIVAAWAVGVAALASAQVYEVVHAFSVPPSVPATGLVQGTDGSFYGTTKGGGGNGGGTVFKIDSLGTLTVLHTFSGGDGSQPLGSLIQASDTRFYGTTSQGGASGNGTVFKIDASGNFTTLHNFAGNDGANPAGSLVQGTDGNFYGTTEYGGSGFFNIGTVFKMTASGSVTTLHTFTGPDGALPVAGLVQGTDGKFYGTTSTGGSVVGTVFQIDSSGTFATLRLFTGPDGAQPSARLIQATDQKFYGTTYGGGDNSDGTVFRIDSAGTFATLHSFTGNDGNACLAGLVQAADGKFYGTTEAGGPTGHGNAFRIDTAGNLTSLHDFSGGSDGSQPIANLIQTSDTNFYGTSQGGGANDGGTVFRMTSAGAVTTLHDLGGTGNGYEPEAGVVRTSDGTLYGTTYRGGSSNLGTVFKIDSAGNTTVLHNFAGVAASDGSNPQGGLVHATDGKFYGTTVNGGTHDLGSVFRIDTSGTLTTLHSFADSDGTGPIAGLIQGTDGKLYGTTQYGGTNNLGTIFRIDTSGTFASLHSLAGSEGAYPAATLLQAADGNFYGTTWAGGDNSQGNVFKMTTALVVTSLYNFTGADDGNFPFGSLVQSGSNFYGTTRNAGANGDGTVFELSSSGSLTTLHPFGGGDGAGPLAGLIKATDGNFYGTTYSGGSGGKGTVFQMTPSGTLTTLHDFSGSDGNGAASSLIQGSDGLFYGTTNQGGAGAAGVVYRLSVCTPPPAPTAGNDGPICAGQTLHLTASAVAGATYSWTGPNGFTSSLQNPSIASATAAASGLYSVTVTVGGCTSAPGTTNATVNPLPSAVITAPTSICPNSTGLIASVPDAGPGATYTWSITNGTITAGAGTRQITFSVSTTTPAGLGVIVTSAQGCSSNGSVSIPVGGACQQSFHTLTPCRVLDTRQPTGPYGGPSLSAATSRTFVFQGQCAIPAGAKSISLNVTAVNPTTGPGFLTLYPGGTSRPVVSTINYNSGKIRANNAIVTLGAAGNIAIYCGQGSGTADVVVDVNGYFQ